MLTYPQISHLIRLLEEARTALPPKEQRTFNYGYLSGLESRIDEAVALLSKAPGYQKHVQVNQLLSELHFKKVVDSKTYDKLHDFQAKDLSE